jgi:O-antigen/teichoic acid export membrane protein
MGVFGALSAIALSYFVTILLSLLILGMSLPKGKKMVDPELIHGKPARYNFSEVYHYFFPAGMALLCLMILTNVDLILVKHFFTPREAGYYSIAQIVGKIVFVLPLPVATVMFPKIASLKMEIQEKKALSVLMHSLAIAGLLCGGATIISFLFPSLIVRILSGRFYPECILLVGIFSVNMCLFSLTFILLAYQLAANERKFLYPLLFLTLIQSGLILLFHKTLVQVLIVVTLIAFSLLVINFYLVYRPRKSNGRERSV